VSGGLRDDGTGQRRPCFPTSVCSTLHHHARRGATRSWMRSRCFKGQEHRRGDLVQVAARYWCASHTTIDPSPTADATVDGGEKGGHYGGEDGATSAVTLWSGAGVEKRPTLAGRSRPPLWSSAPDRTCP